MVWNKGGKASGKGGGVRKSSTKQHGDFSTEELHNKVKRTIGWYNKFGNLTKPIMFKNVMPALDAVGSSEALGILKGLEEKGSSIKDPNAWIMGAAAKMVPDLDPKIAKTLGWYNRHGGLQQEIHVAKVKAPLAALSSGQALKILKGLESKASEIKDPTWWILGAIKKATSNSWSPAQSGGGKAAGGSFQTDTSDASGLDPKIVKTIAWYNKNGGLAQPIDLAAVAPLFEVMETAVALKVLKGLDGKGSQIQNPTNWLTKAIEKTVTGTQVEETG